MAESHWVMGSRTRVRSYAPVPGCWWQQSARNERAVIVRDSRRSGDLGRGLNLVVGHVPQDRRTPASSEVCGGRWEKAGEGAVLVFGATMLDDVRFRYAESVTVGFVLVAVRDRRPVRYGQHRT